MKLSHPIAWLKRRFRSEPEPLPRRRFIFMSHPDGRMFLNDLDGEYPDVEFKTSDLVPQGKAYLIDTKAMEKFLAQPIKDLSITRTSVDADKINLLATWRMPQPEPGKLIVITSA